MANKTVEEIVAKAKSGDMAAFDLLYREYSEKLLKYVVKLGAGRNDAEDIVSDSFMEAIEHIGRFYEACPFMPSGYIPRTKVDLGDTSSLYKFKDITILPQNDIALNDLSACKATLSAYTYVYDGTAKVPDVSIKNGSVTLTENKDYIVNYSSNINIGTAFVTVKGIGNYIGTIYLNFYINGPQPVSTTNTVNSIKNSSVKITMEDGPFYYTGSEIRPKITITDTIYDPITSSSTNVTLTEGKDYTLEYVNNVNYWDAPSVTITGINSYSGLVKKSFSIEFAIPTPQRLHGDVNGDDKVNIKDVMLIQQKIVGWNVVITDANADVIADGKINNTGNYKKLNGV